MTEDGRCESIAEFLDHIVTLSNSALMRDAFINKTTALCRESMMETFKVTNHLDPMADILRELRYPGNI